MSTDLVKEILREAKVPLSVDEIAARIMTRTGSSCNTADVMDALDMLEKVREVVRNGNLYSLA